jgi:hypothetical protein
VSVAPQNPTVQVTQTQNFTATVQNDPNNKGVNWGLSGAGCLGAACGTLSNVTASSVTYTAPGAAPNPPSVTVTATSVTDSTKSASTTVGITQQKPIRVHAGSGTYTDSTGQVWQPDSGFFNVGSLSGCAPAVTVSGTADPTLYKGARWGPTPPPEMQYTFPVANGSYQVNLLFAETCPDLQKVGARVFDVEMQGAVVFSALDIFAAAGANTALVKTATVTVTNGTLAIQFIHHTNNPIISGMEILPVGGAAPPPLPISVAVSPSAASVQVGQSLPFTATVQNDGQNSGVTWSLSGTGCSGASCGTLSATSSASGTAITYTAPSSLPNPATVTLTAKSVTDNTRSASAAITLTASSGTISVGVTPKRGGLTVSQSLSFTASVLNDGSNAGVRWSASGGSFTSETTTSAVYSAPSVAGVYTVTATSVSDPTQSASATLGVTDLGAVATYHNDLSRDGVNVREYALTTSSVNNASFGKLFSCAIDAPAYAQPLWVANLTIGGGTHNVLIAATSHDSVYVFDADASPCITYWHKQLIPTGETWVSSTDVNSTDIFPDIGIVGTPVVDLASSTVYVVAKTENQSSGCAPSSSCHQQLHALSLVDGSEKFNGPIEIASSISIGGIGDGSSGGRVPFNPLTENQRAGLALVNGVVYVSWASHGDNDPYHGWVLGFTASNLALAPALYNVSPNGSRGGIWMSGGAPAADSGNNLYLITGNGTYDGATSSDYGDSFLKLSTSGGIFISDWFTPADESSLEAGDTDFGSGGAAILVDQPSSPIPHLVVGGGKEGNLFVLNRDNLGKFNPTNQVVQTLPIGQPIFATSAFWNNFLYLAGVNGRMNAFSFDIATGKFNASVASQSATSYGFPGATPSISAAGSTNGIVWAIDSSAYGTPCCANGPAVLHAYDAANLAAELWNSTQGSGNAAGNAVKFSVPTVANGKVYIGTRSEVSVYGLKLN